MTRCITYTNRRGQTFHLRHRRNRAGQVRYVFNQTPGPDCVEELPEGYEISEGVNGNVSLRKIRRRTIRPEELAVVRGVLSEHAHLRRCRVADKGKTIVVYEPVRDPYGKDPSEPPVWRSARLEELRERLTDYAPSMRFVLVDRKGRRFAVERMCYRSWVDGWLALEQEGPIEDVARGFLVHLGRESFYELWPY